MVPRPGSFASPKLPSHFTLKGKLHLLKISSPQNPKIKEISRLRDSRERRSSGLFLVEGARELQRALAMQFVCRTLIICSELFSEEAQKIVSLQPRDRCLDVSSAVFAKLAVREGSDGVLAVLEARRWGLSDLPTKPWVLVLENIEKPGNFGALARSADGAGVDAIVVLDPHADLYNPHAIRASIGALFSRPLVTCSPEEFAAFCREQRLPLVTASPFASRFHFEEDLSGSAAIVLGSEAWGLSPLWEKLEHKSVKIPMQGLGDSLNVSVAGAIILYESLRQRLLRKS